MALRGFRTLVGGLRKVDGLFVGFGFLFLCFCLLPHFVPAISRRLTATTIKALWAAGEGSHKLAFVVGSAPASLRTPAKSYLSKFALSSLLNPAQAREALVHTSADPTSLACQFSCTCRRKNCFGPSSDPVRVAVPEGMGLPPFPATSHRVQFCKSDEVST